MLNSVINIYLFIGFIFPLGLTFFKPSETIMSPSFKPDSISIFFSGASNKWSGGNGESGRSANKGFHHEHSGIQIQYLIFSSD